MLENWSEFFPDCQPVAHQLKAMFPSRWVRFHSLPGSKRYPDDEDEFAIILSRQNLVLDELAGVGESVIFLTTEYSGPPYTQEIFPLVPGLREFDRHTKPWRAVPMHDLDDTFDAPSYWHVSASEWAWSPGVFDPVLRLVANDMISNVMIVHPRCRWLFHPYDGGMDVILESSVARDRIKSSHADWLSSRPDGM